jgi:putative endonuclease
MENSKTGKIGEDIAHKYLLNNKYLILYRNHKERFDEIDIIARHPDGTLIFCEVKTLNGDRGSFWGGFMPEDNLSRQKRRKMIRAGQIFLLRHPKLASGDKGWQIDLIAIVLKNGKLADLRHYENI